MLRENNTFLPSSLTRFLVTENLQHVDASPSSNGIVSSKNYNLFLRAHLKSLKIVNQTKHIQDNFVFVFFLLLLDICKYHHKTYYSPKYLFIENLFTFIIFLFLIHFKNRHLTLIVGQQSVRWKLVVHCLFPYVQGEDFSLQSFKINFFKKLRLSLHYLIKEGYAQLIKLMVLANNWGTEGESNL